MDENLNRILILKDRLQESVMRNLALRQSVVSTIKETTAIYERNDNLINALEGVMAPEELQEKKSANIAQMESVNEEVHQIADELGFVDILMETP